ncbi:spore germination protein, GerA family [Halobacteroides halobius DSM 5150]|uniref:Spore germination protein, GerA family n=1 Tax=Halobacteroides halobius (strain ATCC 35273 / DSM 5150 / MD-1) TaxID=748449 RepID=L0K7P0_HALHC|nr:spore germination protein [Halobacteroides halobius]AGB40570.1 spore germination protein, GerA family [Halobacteroides halobius DSM 5150]
MKQKTKISKDLAENLQVIKDQIDGPKTFDFVNRDFKIAGKNASIVFVDGFQKSKLMGRVLEYLMDLKREDLSVDIVKKLIEDRIPVLEVATADTIEGVMDQVLAGPQALFIDGVEQAIIIDARTWMSRGLSEPELEKSTRGPEDGFIETMLFNVKRIRRRIRDPKLRVEALRVGNRGKTDIAVTYIEDIAEPSLVKKVKQKLEDIEVDALPLADRTIQDFLTGTSFNPLPKVRYTNRPDIASAQLLEGKVCVIVDGSPTVLILPATFFDQTQAIEDYRHSFLAGSYLKMIKFVSVFLSLVIPPLWLIFAYSPEWLPPGLEFIGIKQPGKVPIGVQFLLASLGIDLIQVASVQVPSSLATSLGLIGALMLGQFSVKVGLFSPETILYMAIGAIGNFAIPGFELAMAFKVFRFALLLLAIYFRIPGLLIGLAILFLLMAFTKSFGVPYLWPLIPFNWNALKTYLFRQPILKLSDRRPKFSDDDETRK